MKEKNYIKTLIIALSILFVLATISFIITMFTTFDGHLTSKEYLYIAVMVISFIADVVLIILKIKQNKKNKLNGEKHYEL